MTPESYITIVEHLEHVEPLFKIFVQAMTKHKTTTTQE